MNMKKVFYYLSIFFLILGLTTNTFAKMPVLDWSAKTIHDLHRMHDLLVNNTMEYVDQYPPFMKWLNQGLKKSILLAKKSNTKVGYYYTLAYYANGFNNGHIAAFSGNRSFLYRYAGMLLKYQNGKYLVKYVDPQYKDLPPLNAELIACDKIPTQIMINTSIIPFSAYPHQLESSYNRGANNLFFDANPFRQYSTQCIFKINNKKEVYNIHWKTLSPDQSNKVKKLFYHHYPFCIRLFGEKGLWISIPTLSFHGLQTQFFKALLQIMPSFRNYNPIILDVRGNGGGDSIFAFQLLSGLYGENFVAKAIQTHDHSHAIYRISQANVDALSWYARHHLNLKTTALVKLLKKDQAAGKKVSDPMSDMKVEKLPSDVKPLFHGRLYFLTDNRYFSSCFDFADYIHWLPNTTHIGLPTSADSIYTENNQTKLTYGAEFIYAHKVWRNRPRGINVPYIPKYRYIGDISHTSAVMKWVQALYQKKKF